HAWAQPPLHVERGRVFAPGARSVAPVPDITSQIRLPAASGADGTACEETLRPLRVCLTRMPKVRSKALSETVKGILVFPVVTKGGFIVGAPGGEGVLFEK